MLSLSNRSNNSVLKLLSNLLMVPSKPESDCRESTCSAKNCKERPKEMFKQCCKKKKYYNLGNGTSRINTSLPWRPVFSSQLPRCVRAVLEVRPWCHVPDLTGLSQCPSSCSGWIAETERLLLRPGLNMAKGENCAWLCVLPSNRLHYLEINSNMTVTEGALCSAK